MMPGKTLAIKHASDVAGGAGIFVHAIASKACESLPHMSVCKLYSSKIQIQVLKISVSLSGMRQVC